jgi:hypothetical protein
MAYSFRMFYSQHFLFIILEIEASLIIQYL